MSLSMPKRFILNCRTFTTLGSPMILQNPHLNCVRCWSNKSKSNPKSPRDKQQQSIHKRKSISNTPIIGADGDKTTFHPSPVAMTGTKGRTSLQARNEYDNMINDWITTNWLSIDPKIQKTPCHFFIHDKLIYDNFDNFKNVYETLTSIIPFGENSSKFDYNTVRDLWNKEMHTFNDQELDVNNRNLIDSHLRTVLKSIFLRYLKNDNQAINIINKELKDSKFQRKLLRHFKTNGGVNIEMQDKIKNLQNLNIKNDFSIIKDRDWTFFPFIQYNSLIKTINRSNEITKSMEILEYESILGNKINDYKNLEKIQKLLNSGNKNDKFMIITNDREASLEYFRLLKLFNKTESKIKGCVIFLNQNSSEIDILAQFAHPKSYTGNELYYVVDKFNEIYDVLEVL